MLAEISAGLSGLNAAKQIIQGLDAIRTEAALNEVKINLQGFILEAHQGLFAAQQAQAADAARIGELEQEIVRLKDWTAEQEQYELADVQYGALAYRPKEGMKEGEPPHWLCPTCFGVRKKSYLQPEHHIGATESLHCLPCNVHIVTRGRRADIGSPGSRR